MDTKRKNKKRERQTAKNAKNFCPQNTQNTLKKKKGIFSHGINMEKHGLVLNGAWTCVSFLAVALEPFQKIKRAQRW
jgi:hypothetical protein